VRDNYVNQTPYEAAIQSFIQGAPFSTNFRNLEIYEADPASPGSYHLRRDLTAYALRDPNGGSRGMFSGAVYYLPGSNRFYIQWNQAIDSTLKMYGPFDGEPSAVLGVSLPAPRSSAP
jgi:hypothetical protein